LSNGTLALQLLVRALGLTGEVIVPAYTFIASANALEWEGVRPVFCDVAPGTSNIDPNHCRKLVTKSTSAIMGVHVWGKPCDTKALHEIAASNDIRLIFDSAHAFGCGSNSDRMIGSDGDAEVFSFHATKAFHTGEGGAVTTNNSELAKKLKKLRNFGFVDTDKTGCLGINAKMSEFHAAIGLANFINFAANKKKSFSVHSSYAEQLKTITDIAILDFDLPHTYHYVVLLIKPNSPLSRNQLVELLEAENILARRYFYPGCHRMKPYSDREKLPVLPETEKLTTSTLVLPAGANFSTEEAVKVCSVLKAAFNDAQNLKQYLTN
jgi:dTDP-4-amino-4,6-dideoxygalactose transaminase